MIVKPNVIVAEGLEKGIYPVGTQLRFSAYDVMDPATGYPEPFMAPGILSGYDSFGGALVVIERIDEETHLPTGAPTKVINTKSLRRFMEFIEIEPGTETISTTDHLPEHFFDNQL